MGEKTHKQNPPKIPGQSRENFAYVFFSLCVFFAPKFFERQAQEPERKPWPQPAREASKSQEAIAVFWTLAASD